MFISKTFLSLVFLVTIAAYTPRIGDKETLGTINYTFRCNWASHRILTQLTVIQEHSVCPVKYLYEDWANRLLRDVQAWEKLHISIHDCSIFERFSGRKMGFEQLAPDIWLLFLRKDPPPRPNFLNSSKIVTKEENQKISCFCKLFQYHLIFRKV